MSDLKTQVDTTQMLAAPAFMKMSNEDAAKLIDQVIDHCGEAMMAMLASQKILENLNECKNSNDMKNIPEPFIMNTALFDMIIEKVDSFELTDVSATCLAMNCVSVLKSEAGGWIAKAFKDRGQRIIEENKSRIIKPY